MANMLARGLLTTLMVFWTSACQEHTIQRAGDALSPEMSILSPVSIDSIRDPAARAALQAMPGARVLAITPRGMPKHIQGDLGHAGSMTGDLAAVEQRMKPVLDKIAPAFGLKSRDLRIKKLQADELAYQHVKLSQLKDGLPVVDTMLIIHIDSLGQIFAANGTLGEDESISPVPLVDSVVAVSTARKTAPRSSLKYGSPRLVYVLEPRMGPMHLAWEMPEWDISSSSAPVSNRVYVDSHTGRLVKRSNMAFAARNRWIYDNSKDGPGGPYLTLENRTMVETSTSCATWAECHLFNGFADVHAYFANGYGRDSYDDAGATLKGEAHCWNATQGDDIAFMVYVPNGTYDPVAVFGDGFLDNSSTLKSLDIVAHEFSHAMSWEEAALAYRFETGALSEGISDIMAARVECYTNGNCTYDTTYTIGESSPRGAFRWMYKPTLNCPDPDAPPGPAESPRCGRDHTSIMYTCATADASNGYCYTHHNAGIPNLQFKMLASGGYHPRGVAPNNNVTAIGWWAVAVWYRALNYYMTSTETFDDARLHTIMAANDYFGAGSTESWATHYAWANVGVPAN